MRGEIGALMIFAWRLVVKTPQALRHAAEKTANLRIFEDYNGKKMNLSLLT